MITLNASGSSVTFTFDGNSTYLNDGTITVPKNSLALIVDESDMATFRKAASNDIFVSANISEFGMTKAELESWYKANMVGSTGGGGGVTTGEVQTMIDEAVSGKVDADFDNSLGFDINDDLGVYAEGNSEDIVFNTASSKVKEYTFPSVYTNGSNNIYKVGFNSSVSLELNQSFSGTVSTTKAIGVKYLDTNDELKECWWDYSNNAFTINSDYSANNSVRLYYNSSNHRITLSRQNTSLKTIVTIIVGGDYYIASSSNPTEADCYISYIKIYTPVKKLQSVLNEKQRQLTAGDGIKLDNYGNISANIKVTGDTHTNVLNSESATTGIFVDDIKNVDMWLNQSYTGTPSGWYTIGVLNLDWVYDYYLYENDTFTFVSGSAGSTLNYDSSTGKVSITCPSGISSINNVWKFAPKDDLTNADCFIGLVSYTSNEYTIQEALDNKVDASDVTTAVTSGSTDAEIPTAKAVYDALGQGGGSSNLPISAGTGTGSVKENYVNNVASGSYSHAEGRGTSASGDSSHAEGNGTSAKGNYAHAEGHSTVASGDSSHAEGELTNANGIYSHAEGTSTKANNVAAHAEGRSTTASGKYAHTEGMLTVASGQSAHAEGNSTRANGSNSHSEGDNTIANNESEHASGEYNVSNTGESTSAQTLFSVGNGGWDETAQDVVRHNAFEIRKNGDIYFFDGANDVKLQEAMDNKQDTLVAGENITISGNVISATGGGGGGGSTYTAGTGIDITNDVISVKMSVGEPSGYPYYSSLNPNATGTTTSERFLYNILGSGYKTLFDFNNARNNQTSKVGYIFYDKTSTTTVSGHTGYGVLIRIYEYNSTNQLYHSNAIIDWKNKEIFFYNKSSASFDTSIVKTIWDYYGKNSILLYTEPLWDDEGMGGQYALDVSNQSGWDGTILNSFDRSDSKCGAYKFYQNANSYSLSSTVYNHAKLTENNLLMINDVNAALGGLKLQQISQADYDALVSGGTVDSSTLYVII